MSCCPKCGSEIVVNVPGTSGVPGANGQNGSAGVNAFTITTADLTIPAISSNVTVLVANSSWMAVGQNVFASDGTNIGNFQVVSFPSNAAVVLKFLGYTGDTGSGGTISSGATVSPAGLQGTSPSTPISIADGGTNAATKANAQTNLGLGQDALIASSFSLAQVITNSFVEVGTCDITVTDVGQYLLMANVVVSMSGVTFASSRNITIKIRNITQGVDICSQVFPTQILTTTSIPSFSMVVPLKLDATAVANDHYQLLISIDTVNSAGTLAVQAGSICAIPLRLS